MEKSLSVINWTVSACALVVWAVVLPWFWKARGQLGMGAGAPYTCGAAGAHGASWSLIWLVEDGGPAFIGINILVVALYAVGIWMDLRDRREKAASRRVAQWEGESV